MAGRITIVGLGPGDPTARTLAAQQALNDAERIILRTRIHPGVADLSRDPRVTTCDDLYERSSTFDEVYAAIAERVLAASREGDIIFAIPGHPLFGEQSVRIIQERAAGEGIEVTFIDGLSAVDALATALNLDPMATEVQLIDGAALTAVLDQDPYAGTLSINPTRPCLVNQVYARDIASAVKLVLTRLYPDDHAIILVRAASVPGKQQVVHCALHELDHQPVDHLTSVYLPPLAPLDAHRYAGTLSHLVARLRAPGGCPWDREQSHQSLRNALLEEAYETVDAIDANDTDNLVEELGDLLLHVSLHAQVAEEAGDFSIEDVYDQVNQKLIRRHPHVFSDVQAHTPGEVVKTWNSVKAEERRAKATPTPDGDGLPRSMPALLRAERLLRRSVQPGNPPELSVQRETLEDTLLNAVIALMENGIQPENALNRALQRFISRSPNQSATDPATSRTNEEKVLA